MTLDRYLTFGGVPVRFRLYYPPEDVRGRVLLLPSPLLQAEHFDRMAQSLSESGYLCIACDLPGFGKNGRRIPDRRAIARMLWGMLDEIDTWEEGRFSCWHIIAHGLSAKTALDMVELSADAVASLVLLCPALYIPSFLKRPRIYSFISAWASSRRHCPSFVRLYFGRSMDSGEWSPLRRAFLRSGVSENLQDMLMAEPPKEPLCLFAPKLVLWGGKDSILGSRIPPALRALLPDGEFHTLRTAGHVPMGTHANALQDYLRGWLSVNGS